MQRKSDQAPGPRARQDLYSANQQDHRPAVLPRRIARGRPSRSWGSVISHISRLHLHELGLIEVGRVDLDLALD
jgi:hypothetical protein